LDDRRGGAAFLQAQLVDGLDRDRRDDALAPDVERDVGDGLATGDRGDGSGETVSGAELHVALLGRNGCRGLAPYPRLRTSQRRVSPLSAIRDRSTAASASARCSFGERSPRMASA